MKASVLTVRVDQRWVLDNRNNGSAKLMDRVLEAAGKYYDKDKIEVLDKTFNVCRFVVMYEENRPDKQEFLDFLNQSVDSGANFDVDIKNLTDEEASAILKKDSPDTKSAEDKEPHKAIDEVDITDRLIGMEPVKQWVRDMKMLADKYKDVLNKTGFIYNSTYLISINRGNGLSTILKTMAETLSQTGLVEFQGGNYIIEHTLKYQEEVTGFESLGALQEMISAYRAGKKDFRGIVAISIEEWIDKLNDRRIDDLLKFVWKNKDTLIFVFTIPYTEDKVIGQVYDRLNDIVNVRTMKIVPPSDAEYYNYFKGILGEYDLSAADDAEQAFISKIIDEKNDGRFYGYNTVKKVADDIWYNCLIEAARKNEDIPKEISADDFNNLYGISNQSGMSGMDKLSSMVALEEVKNKIKEILSTVKLQKELHAQGSSDLKPCFHMMFSGNPGTGKTVVARIIGQIFREEGLLSVGNFFEVSRKDFIGKFVGHTAPKTVEICRNAYGSVLFIDEAYLLADQRDSYSSEAIGTLIAEMENNRDKMIVIFAGYEDELEKLFDINPGLRDRIPHKINFPNYNRIELEQIFFMQIDRKMKYDSSFTEKSGEFFANLSDEILNSKDFSNGRFVRNLAERIISKAAMRFEMSADKYSNLELTGVDFDSAVADTDFKALMSRKEHSRRVGF